MAAERRRRQQQLLGVVLAGAVVVALVIGAIVHRNDTRSKSSAGSASGEVLPSTPTGPVTTQQAVVQVPDRSGIDGVLAWDTGDWPGPGTASHAGVMEHQHVDGAVTYDVTPPVGGPHNPVWMNAGVYTDPIPAERAVHNLEHGAVWISYRPDLPDAQVSALREFVEGQSLIDESPSTGIPGQKSRYIDMAPWPSDDLPAPIVISSWGHQLWVDQPTDPRLQQFVDIFRNSRTYSPEYGEGVDGVPVQTGGRPAAGGASEPNPTGTAGARAGMPGG